VGQGLEVQLDQLAHCDKVFQEKTSATSTTRPTLKACLAYLREGDTLVMTRLDRLARSTLHLCQMAQVLERKGVNLHVLEQHIDTRDATGRLVFHLLGAIGAFETDIRTERQLEGIAKAKARGVRFGPKKRLTPEQITELQRRRTQGDLIYVLMADYGLSKTSVYRYLRTRDGCLTEET
jgi:DNA invertase Pin-like site-specific DNA recombinase